eukprot:2869784-Karenia_brevis.AAC.1
MSARCMPKHAARDHLTFTGSAQMLPLTVTTNTPTPGHSVKNHKKLVHRVRNETAATPVAFPHAFYKCTLFNQFCLSPPFASEAKF